MIEHIIPHRAHGEKAACLPLDKVQLLTPMEVAAIFRVDRDTVIRWAASGRIDSIRTPGGHRRFRPDDVEALLAGDHAESHIADETADSAPEGVPA